jgi:hypothetical protein
MCFLSSILSRPALPSLAFSALILTISSTSFAELRSLDCQFKWSEQITAVRHNWREEALSQGNSPRDGNSPRFNHSSRSESASSGLALAERNRLSLSMSASPSLSSSPLLAEAASPLLNSPRAGSPRNSITRLRSGSIETTASGLNRCTKDGAKFGLNGTSTSMEFEILGGCSARFELTGSVERVAASIYLFCKTKGSEAKNAVQQFVRTLDPQFAKKEVFELTPEPNAISGTAWHERHGRVQKEITQFTVECTPFDPEATSEIFALEGEETSNRDEQSE